MSVSSTLTIDGTAYTASERAAAHVLPTNLERSLEGYDTLTFSEIPTTPAPTYVDGQLVSLAVDLGNGDGAATYFSGIIVDVQSEHGPYGWQHAYTCLGLKYLADRVPVTAVDNTGTAVYNRSPLDDFYNSSDAGLELGEIIKRVLTIPATAQALNAYGIGNYTGLPSAPVLPAGTLADLALLTVVPPRPVIFQGEAVMNAIDQEVSQWMPKFFSEIAPDGTIRFNDSTDTTTRFAPQTMTCPSASAAGDPVTTPRVQRSTRNCATRLIFRGGPQVEVAILSMVDGTLAEVFTSTDKTNWNLTYFTAPQGKSDYGTISATTSTSATLTSHDASATWVANFWSTNNATIQLIDPLASLISQFEARLATSNDALTAGGSSTVNWDSSWPISSTSYTQYRITGGSGGLNDCWRTYTPREPATGNTGLDTYVGAHLVTRSSFPVTVATQQQSFPVYFTTATVVGGSLGQEFPAIVQPVPSQGIFRFTQPTVTVFGQPSDLNSGSPTDAAHGLPLDVIVYALYSRGVLSVTVPADVAGVPQYEGTAYTEDGIETTKQIDFPGWIWLNDTTSFGALAQQVLDTMKNAEVDISIDWYISPDGDGPAWDWLSFGYSLNVAIADQDSPWDGLNAPIRSMSVRWDWTGQVSMTASFHASTRRRAFSGFDLYIHPAFSQTTPLGGAFMGSGSSGNFQQYSQALADSGVSQADQGALTGQGNGQAWQQSLGQYGTPGFATPNDVIGSAMAGQDSGFTLADTLRAGMDNGAGIRDAATSPDRYRKQKAQARPITPESEPLKRPDSFVDSLMGSSTAAGKEMLGSMDSARTRDEGKKKARQQENRSRLARIEGQRKAENAARAKAQADATQPDRNLDAAIDQGRQSEAVRQHGEAKSQAKAKVKARKMLAGSMPTAEPFGGTVDASMASNLPSGSLPDDPFSEGGG